MVEMQTSEERQELFKLCVGGMARRGCTDDRYKKRLKYELRYIDDLGDHAYFLDLAKGKRRFPKNEHNLFVAYVLGLVEYFDIEREPEFFFGESPDIDTDYLPQVQKYLKDDWAPKEFGAQNVCPIGNYGTFGIKSGFIDAARVYGKDRNEILSITTTLEDKDEEGKPVTFETAYQMCPELKAYAERNPEVAEAAQALNGRNRSLGKHAGGLIIANSPITQYVPLIRGREESQPVSAFVEGLHGQDLGPMGLIKYDLLVVKDLERIAMAKSLVKERTGIKSMCAKPGLPDWSDTSYLNDPKALAMANRADLKGIFQFDSDGIRRMVKDGGVSSFDDIAAYSALYRPGPLGVEMDKTYVKRKRKLEEYELHPVLNSILDVTMGVYCYQEQVMATLHKVGGIPLTQCEKLRKAISKKKVEEFASAKNQFIEHGQKVLSWPQAAVEELWGNLETWSGYGFNRSHSYSYGYTSGRLLYLKAHHPLEFFTATLANESTAEKLKEYKLDAERHGIKVNPVQINKSGWNFQIVDDEIYMGYSNVKGVGEAVARRIVEHQPYASFGDFLARFGCDGAALKPLICLGVFDTFDKDRCKLLEFSDKYRESIKSREARDKRADKSVMKIVMDFGLVLRSEGSPEFTDEDVLTTIRAMSKYDCVDDLVKNDGFQLEGLDAKTLHKLAKKYKRTVDTLAQKQVLDAPLAFEDFQPTGEIDEELKVICGEIMPVAEAKFYGFNWDHVLKYSPDFEGGMSFARFVDEDKVSIPVEVQVVRAAERKVSKKGNSYYSMKVEDVDNVQANVNIWREDFERFQEEFTAWDKVRQGNLLRIRLERPSGGFPTYTFESPPRHMRDRLIPSEKERDYRLVLLRTPYRTKTSSSTPPISTDTSMT